MTDERRYREEEVEEIFALATRLGEGSSVPAHSDEAGLTLEQLQAVGREVGIPPERVAEAAAALDARPVALPRRTRLGFPVSVGRVVELPRAATEREWRFLVAELRETFEAKGRVSSHGGIREWSNGNLHAVLEQTEAGHRLRLGTRKGSVPELATVGVIGLVMAVIMTVALAAQGRLDAMFIPALFAIGGGATLATTFLRLPGWADERERQMDRIARRARGLIETPPQD